MSTTISQSFAKIGSKTKNFYSQDIFCKQTADTFNYLKKPSLNFAQNFRECSFNLAGSESGEKSTRFENFAYISQLFVYKIHIWTQLCTCSRYRKVRPLYAFVLISRSFQTVGFFFQASCLFTKSHKCKQKNHKAFSYPLYLHFYELWRAENFFGNRKLQKT